MTKLLGTSTKVVFVFFTMPICPLFDYGNDGNDDYGDVDDDDDDGGGGGDDDDDDDGDDNDLGQGGACLFCNAHLSLI